MSPLHFVFAIFAAYATPAALDAPPFVSWGCVEAVYLYDMEISRQRFPDEMNGPELSTSEKMTYCGMAGAALMGVVEEKKELPPFVSFGLYFVLSSATYTIWHYLDTGQLKW